MEFDFLRLSGNKTFHGAETVLEFCIFVSSDYRYPPPLPEGGLLSSESLLLGGRTIYPVLAAHRTMNCSVTHCRTNHCGEESHLW